MKCPICGTEASGDVCPLCGTSLAADQTNNVQEEGNGAAGGFKLQGMEINKEAPGATGPYASPASNDFSDLENEPYNVSNTDYKYNSASQATYKKSSSGGIVSLIIALVVVAAVLVWFFVFREDGVKKSKELIEQYVTSMEAGDIDSLVELVDPDCIKDGEVEEVAQAFTLLKSLGMEYTVDYTINSTEKASEGLVKSMCGNLYNDASKAKKVKKAYVCDITLTINMSYLGESESQTQDQKLICYKMGNKWYIGGYVGN